jgi:osmotically inducible protein OsmC
LDGSYTTQRRNFMAAVRTAEAHWEGSLKEGKGEVQLVSSGLGTYDVTWAARTEQPNGKTSPEELIAAAHSTCFSMSLSLELTQAGLPAPTSVDTKAEVTFVPGGPGITESKLTVSAVVPGVNEEQFQEAVAAAERNCPVSRALAGTKINVEASLAS